MKRIVTNMLLLLMCINLMAQQDIKFTISDGIKDYAAKQRMEQAISELLSEINRACAQERSLYLDNIDMDISGKRSLQSLWQNLHFLCEDNEIVERCLNSVEGYVVRNIFVQVNPMIEDYTDERERALTIRLTRTGQIANVTLSASDAVYGKIMQKGYDILDLERRQTILSFVENYRSHYDEKDINSLRQIFSDDAIIITATVPTIKPISSDIGQWKEHITYKIQDKEQYLSSLADNFRRNKYIKVTFSDIEVVRHPSNPDYYGVTLHQHWKSSTYEDDGYILLVWEFHDGMDPVIHYRTWHPERGSFSKEDMINIMDFDIPSKD